MDAGRILLVMVLCGGLSGCLTAGGATRTASNVEPVKEDLLSALGTGLIGTLETSGVPAADRKRALEAEYRALEYGKAGEPVNWQNGWTGNKGVVVAAQPYRVGAQDCRPYSHTVNINDKAGTARGTACRNTDGSWTPLL